MKKTFKCKYCKDDFVTNVFPSNIKRRTFDFCSPVCRNKSRQLDKIPCPHCGKMFKPQVNDTINGETVRKKFCSNKCGNRNRCSFTKKDDEFIKRHYPTKAGDWVASELGRTKEEIQNRAYNLGITLNDDIYQERVHEAAREYMIENNHMKNPEVVEKVKDYYRRNPEKRKEATRKIVVANQKYQKDNPTKLEKRLHKYLDKLQVEYEPFAVIKKNFVVDICIGDLIIEADGDYWHGHPRFEPLTDRQIRQQKRDAARNKYLTTCGYTVIRIWESDMTFDLVKKILENHNII